jgi:phosphate transport system substrate-binding protein
MVLSSSEIKKNIISSILEFSMAIDSHKNSGKYSQAQISEMLSLAIEINNLINYLDKDPSKLQYVSKLSRPKLPLKDLSKMKRVLELSFKYNSDINSLAIDIGENLAVTNRYLSKGIDYILLNLAKKDFKTIAQSSAFNENKKQQDLGASKFEQSQQKKQQTIKQVRTVAKKQPGVSFFGFVFFMIVLGAISLFIYNSIFNRHATGVTSLVKEYRSDRKLGSVQRPMIASALTVEGTKSLLILFEANKQDFINQNPKLDFEIADEDSGIAIANLIDGKSSLAAVSRIPTLEERKIAASKNKPLADHRIALDSVVFFVNPSNPVETLTTDELKEIYGKDLMTWNALTTQSSSSNKIARFSLSKQSGTFTFFKDRIMFGEEVTENVIHIYKPDQLLEMVASNPDAIGFCSLSVFMNKEILNRSKVKILRVGSAFDDNGTKPIDDMGHLDAATVRSGEYPLTRYLYLISAGELDNAQAQFIDFMRSPLVQNQMTNYGLVGIE